MNLSWQVSKRRKEIAHPDMMTVAEAAKLALLADFLEEELWRGQALLAYLEPYKMSAEEVPLVRATIQREVYAMRTRAGVTQRASIIRPQTQPQSTT